MKHKQSFSKQLNKWLHRPVKNESISPVIAYLLLGLIALGLATLIYLTKSNTDIRSQAANTSKCFGTLNSRCKLGSNSQCCKNGFYCKTLNNPNGTCQKSATPKPVKK
jgi:hypothetical protein